MSYNQIKAAVPVGVWFLLLSLICIVPSFAQNPANVHTAHLKNAVVAFQPNLVQWADSCKNNPPRETGLILLHMSKDITADERAKIAGSGIQLLDYLPGNTFIAWVQPGASFESIKALPAYGIEPFATAWKASNYMWHTINEQAGSVEVLVSFHRGLTSEQVREFISSAGGQIKSSPLEKYGSYKVVLKANTIKSFASWYGVAEISPVTGMVPLDLQTRAVVKANFATAPAMYGGYGLYGDGVTVGVGDNSPGTYHADLKDRITNFHPGSLANHGEHVNGIVGGAANINPLELGMAPHCNLVDHQYDLILSATGSMYRDYNMTITNNSYGVILGDCSYSGTYDAYAHFLDTLAMQYPDVLHVFASGNDGLMHCSPYPIGFGTVGGGYQPAKNCLVVGSIAGYLSQADDESRGPVLDGRLKPEIVAVGYGQYSTIGVDNYEWAAGTSMASPQVAGCAALVTQRFRQVFGGITPQADILKPLLMNGAMDLGNPGPDYTYGFGALDVYHSLKMVDNNRIIVDSIDNGATQTYTINVPANTAQAKIMLYWHDVPASASAANQLVNDLDLSILTPSGINHLPLVLDTIPANVERNATEKEDHVNNVEQVVIDSPAAGNYTLKIKGFHVPFPKQRFVIVYDFLPAGLKLTYPIGGEQHNNSDSIRVYWETLPDGHTFKIEATYNNGVTWQSLADSVGAQSRYFPYMPVGVNSNACRIRITKNGLMESAESGNYTVNNNTELLLNSDQCPGYIGVHWQKVPGATKYQLLSKQGAFMQAFDYTTDTNYIFKNMSMSEPSYVAVLPYINGTAGYRSVALKTIANMGNCNSAVSAGDLMIEKVLSPQSGRMYTHSQLTNSQTLKLKVRNLYNVSCNSYSVSYQINSGAWQAFTTTLMLPANDTAIVTIPGLDLSAPGNYIITCAIHNQVISDPQTANDTVTFMVSNLQNDNVTLPFLDDFETLGKMSLSQDSIGITPNAHWDFLTGDSSGRIRSFVDDNVTLAGNRSMSLDENKVVSNGSHNQLIGTFNLSAFDTGTVELRMDFDYLLHGTPKTTAGNLVQVRPVDTLAWQPWFTYNLTAYPGSMFHVPSLSLTDAARQAQSNFSSAFQVAFGQSDTSLIAARDYGNGITIDNVKIYSVANDAQMAQIISPAPSNCGLAGSQPITIQVHNGVNYTLRNIQVFFSLDSGTVYSGTIDSITAKNTINYTFSQQMVFVPGVQHVLNTWLADSSDTYNVNDSILQFKFRNNMVVTSYPYIENFESGIGGFYADGVKCSWQFGTPASPKINKAASGSHAWKTNLKGTYNNLEQSYLYSPCYELSSLNNPMLSFSAALDVENCGNTLCDQAFVEYSFDGATWRKLGGYGLGTNWYDSTFDVWNNEGFTRWHVASIPIPLPVGNSVIRFRFALNSDPGATFEGFAVDDIHIFDKATSIARAPASLTTASISGNRWIDQNLNGSTLLSTNAWNHATASLTAKLYPHDMITNPGATQYIMPRSYALSYNVEPGDSTGYRLYLLDSEFVNVYGAGNCPSCPRPADAYSLGITQFTAVGNAPNCNNYLADDTNGIFNFIPANQVMWVPQDNGYYAEFKAQGSSEFWFNDGGPTASIAAGLDDVHFTAARLGNDAALNWQAIIDTAIGSYTIERSRNDTNFTSIYTFPAFNTSPGLYSSHDAHVFPQEKVLFYRLKYTLTGKTNAWYTPVRRVDNTDSAGYNYLFDAEAVTRTAALVSWTAYADGVTNRYILEREIDNAGYQVIDTELSFHTFGQRYQYIDAPKNIPIGGASLHYRLAAMLDDGDTAHLPIKTLLWPNAESVPAIYPNPSADGSINITWFADAGTTMQVGLCDITGKKIYESSFTATQWVNTTNLALPFRLNNGVYIVRLTINGVLIVSKVVVE